MPSKIQRFAAQPLAAVFRPFRCCGLVFLLAAAAVHAQDKAVPAERPTGLEAQVTEAYNFFENGKPQQALDAFGQVLEQDTDFLPARLGEAMIYAEQQKHVKAFKAFDLVVQSHPRHTFAWNGRGLAACNLQNFNEALSSFEQATRDEPVNGFYYESLAWTYLCLGDYAKARNSAKTATLMYHQKGESSAYPLLIAYFSSLESGAIADAKRTLEYALSNKPPHNSWPYPVFDYLAGQVDASELVSFVKDSAQETEAHTYIGLMLRAAGDATHAAAHLRWVAEHGDKRVFEFTLARALNAGAKVAAVAR